MPLNKICVICGTEFQTYPYRAYRTTCSKKCMYRQKSKPLKKKKCLICKKWFKYKRHRTNVQFCSKKCMGLGMRKKGSTYINQRGYVMELVGVNHYMLQHRLVVERYLGRFLTHTEVIHHRDRNKQNNSIKNLAVFKNQKLHLQFHAREQEKIDLQS